MALIIAIESDHKRRRLLAMLIREFVQVDVKVVDSVPPALELMRARIPDLVLTPALLAPRDSADLIAFVKEIDAPYVQLVTLPALDMLGDGSPEVAPGRRWLPVLLRRRPAPSTPQYDRAIVGAQIADALERAREAREDHRAAQVRRAAMEAEMALVRLETQSVIRALEGGDLRHADRDDLMRVANALERQGHDRRRARRRPLADFPWVSGVELEWATDAALVNLSTSGALVETGSKLTPGTTTELRLSSPAGALVVPARVIRSEIARIDGFGVRYHAAAAFDRDIDLSMPQHAGPAVPPEKLAQLLATALAEPRAAGEPAHVRFARGLRELVGARDVQVRTMYSAPASGPETLYFDVPGTDRARTTLQVVFPRNHYVTSSEFQLLKAAAWLTAAALEFEQTSVSPSAASTTASSFTTAPRGAAMIAEAVA
jgi:PilZ domain-containing protein